MRFAVKRYRGGIRVINDSYNANPVSMQAALEAMGLLPGEGRRAAVLGDMLELGSETEAAHRRLGTAAAAAGLDLLVAVGRFSRFTAEGAVAAGMSGKRVQAFPDPSTAAEAIGNWIGPADLLLVKGSRGVRLERLLAQMKEDGTLEEEGD
jgi:UDP-N-acetylmuramoyl-tripeptide--D-alanyl-D-alanine ligase